MVCEPDEPREEGDGAENKEPEAKKGHGGCGHIQPQIRKEGLKLFVQYKPKDDDDVSSFPPWVILIFSNLMDVGGEVSPARQEGHRTVRGAHSFQEDGGL
jgi:hypothetical protein